MRTDCVYEDVTPGPAPNKRRTQTPSRPEQASSTPLGLSPRSLPLPLGETGRSPSSLTIVAAPIESTSAEDVDDTAKSQAGQVEKQTDSVQSHATTSHSDPAETSTSQPGEAGHIHRLVEHSFFGETQVLERSMSHKLRLFGQSHWMTVITLFRDIIEMIAPHLRDEQSDIVSGMRRCKALAKAIKSRRAPAWPTPPTTTLPAKNIADELVDAYLRTTETVYRVLHIPTFKRDYEAFWLSGMTTKGVAAAPARPFLVQLKLVLAIGAATHDDQFSLRASAVTWVYEAQTYLSAPGCKSRLDLRSLQTGILALIAREATGVDSDSTWIAAGALVRTAMHMGLHRDPSHLPRRPRHVAEMRRRLWNTILELALQSSMAVGQPPLVSLEDFDTRAPGNFDDDQLTINTDTDTGRDENDDDPIPRPDGEATQMSVAIALRKMFPLRLAIAKFLNDSITVGPQHSGYGYNETLRLDAELRALYRDVCRTLLLLLPPSHKTTNVSTADSRFDISALEVIVHRYLVALHVPYLGKALHDAAYAYSRKVAVDSALRIWYTATSSWPSISTITTTPTTTITPSNTLSSDLTPFARFTLCGSGFFRTAAFQATLVIGLETRAQLREDADFSLDRVGGGGQGGGEGGIAVLRPDLLTIVLETAKHFSLRCVVAGETNVKGYLLNCLVAAQVEGILTLLRRRRRGSAQDDDEIGEGEGMLLRAAGDAVRTCLGVLEDMHRGVMAVAEDGDGDGDGDGDVGSGVGEDWDFLDALFSLGNGMTDPMSWMVDEAGQQASCWQDEMLSES